MRMSLPRIFRTLALCLALMLITPAALADGLTSITCGITATEDIQLRPLELNQRDMVSVLDMVYEGLFAMDDNYQP